MKFWGIFRFELAYQLRRPWPWLAFVVLVVFSFLSTSVAIIPATLPQDFILNSPFIITSVTVFSCQIWLLVAPMVAGDAAAQTARVMQNLLAVVKAAGHEVSDICRCTIYLRSMGDFAAVNAVYAEALGEHRPARATVEVSRLPKDVLVEIDAICAS